MWSGAITLSSVGAELRPRTGKAFSRSQNWGQVYKTLASRKLRQEHHDLKSWETSKHPSRTRVWPAGRIMPSLIQGPDFCPQHLRGKAQVEIDFIPQWKLSPPCWCSCEFCPILSTFQITPHPTLSVKREQRSCWVSQGLPKGKHENHSAQR